MEAIRVSCPIILSNKLSTSLLAPKERAISACVTFDVVGQDTFQRYYGLAHSHWPLILSGVRLERATVGYLSTGTHSPHFASPSSISLSVLPGYPQTSEDMVGSTLLFPMLICQVALERGTVSSSLSGSRRTRHIQDTVMHMTTNWEPRVIMSSGFKLQLNESANPQSQYSVM